MSEDLNQEVTPEQQPEKKKKNLLTRLKQEMDERDEQLVILSTLVRLVILVWSGIILTLAYVKLPPELYLPEQDFDPTFIASVFTGVLATFGVQTARNKGDCAGMLEVEDVEKLLEAVSKVSKPSQTVEVKQSPIKLVSEEKADDIVVDPED